MMKKSLFVALATVSLAALAAEIEVGQIGNNFSQKSIKIKVGDTVVFKNNDAHFHNIFSLSEGQSFDLGSYGQGQTRKHTFNKPGKVDIECAIHPSMRLTVEVAP
jgi:plastocyanin